MFFGVGVVIVGGAVVVPDLLGAYGGIARLILALAVVGLCGIAIDAILQVRAGARAVTSFLPLALIVLIVGVTFPGEIAALAKSFATRGSPGIWCAPGED